MATVLDEKGFIFVGNDGNAYRCCMWDEEPWLFRWQDSSRRWVSVMPVTPGDIFSFPRNLTQEQQDLYSQNEAK